MIKTTWRSNTNHWFIMGSKIFAEKFKLLDHNIWNFVSPFWRSELLILFKGTQMSMGSFWQHDSLWIMRKWLKTDDCWSRTLLIYSYLQYHIWTYSKWCSKLEVLIFYLEPYLMRPKAQSKPSIIFRRPKTTI